MFSDKQAVVFFRKSLAFLGVQALIAALLWNGVVVLQNRYHYQNWTTESALRMIPWSTHFDLLILGTSHARTFSRNGNHLAVERILGVRMVNLARGGGGGVVPAALHTKIFFDRGNTAQNILYFVDAWVFYSSKWNDVAATAADQEPLDLGYLITLLRFKPKMESVWNYIWMKFTVSWITDSPLPDTRNLNSLARVDQEVVRKRIANIYQDGLDDRVFNHYSKYLDSIVQMAFAKGTKRIYLVFPPTLLGGEPGIPRLQQHLLALAKLYKPGAIVIRDFSRAVPEPSYYEDHDHLNSAGVEFFTRTFLKPMFAQKTPAVSPQ